MTHEQYETLAEDFYRETGMMAPGKDDRTGFHTRKERRERWTEWLDELREEAKSQSREDLTWY